jgi:phycoerythrin-associated linker protein
MDIHQFLELFVGRWRSQRSDHQFGAGNGSGDTRSVIEMIALELDDHELIAICQKNNVDPNTAIHPMRMSWDEESLNTKKPKGSALIIPVPNNITSPQKGLILSEQSKGVYELGADESLTIQTVTFQGVIEERIWYGNPNLRFRVATLLQKDSNGDRHVQSSKFYSEIRSATPKTA